MPVFNGNTLTITLDSGVTEVDVQNDLYEAWKNWQLERPQNRGYPQAFRTVGGDPLSSIINAGAYFFLNNSAGWRIKPPEEDITIYLTGNLAVEDTALPAFKPTDGDFTAAILGLQPVTQGVTPVMAEQLRHSSFNGGVWVDAVNGSTIAIIGDEAGTTRFPVNTMDEALFIANSEGFNTFFIIGDITVNSGLNYQDKVFVGQGKNLSIIDVDGAANVLNCTFTNAEITGTLDGDSKIEECIISNLSFVSGVLERCILNPGTITLGGSQVAHIIDCVSGVPGTGTPTINCGGSGQPLGIRGYNGGIRITNKSGPESVSIDLNSGQIKLTGSVTAGTIVCRGVGKLVDDASGDRVLGNAWNGATVVNELIDSQDVQLARKLLSNRVVISADDSTTTIYDDDGTTVLWTFTHSSPRTRTPA